MTTCVDQMAAPDAGEFTPAGVLIDALADQLVSRVQLAKLAAGELESDDGGKMLARQFRRVEQEADVWVRLCQSESAASSLAVRQCATVADAVAKLEHAIWVKLYRATKRAEGGGS